jgi:hypothetical protein
MLEETLKTLVNNLKKQFYLLFLPLSIIAIFQIYKFLFPAKSVTEEVKTNPKLQRPKLKTELPNEVIRLSSVKTIPRKEFGKTELDWLNSEHMFNFGKFKKENNEGFGFVRSFNLDNILPSKFY